MDECDKPIIDHLYHPGAGGENRKLLQDFFATLKNLETLLKFTFVTGLCEFS
ncbi:MAG: AAA family ATPase [Roseivirga sp.]